MASSPEAQAEWPEAMAEVTDCHYDVRAGRALAFGLTSKKHFRIGYNYLVDGELHTGECFSEQAMPQGTLFPIHYDPELPHVNRSTIGGQPGGQRRRVPLIAIGIAGSIVLSFAWFLILRGCN